MLVVLRVSLGYYVKQGWDVCGQTQNKSSPWHTGLRATSPSLSSNEKTDSALSFSAEGMEPRPLNKLDKCTTTEQHLIQNRSFVNQGLYALLCSSGFKTHKGVLGQFPRQGHADPSCP